MGSMMNRGVRTVLLVGGLVWGLTGCAASDRGPTSIRQAESSTVASISAQAQTLRAQQAPRLGVESRPKDYPSAAPVTALLVNPQQLPDGLDLTLWCRELVRAGITTVVIEAWSTSEAVGNGEGARKRGGLYFQSSLAPVSRDIVTPLVGAAHQQGLMVYASVGLRRLPWLDAGLGWGLPAYDPTRQGFVGSDHVDLLHPAYQEFLAGLLKDLTATGIDGLLIRADGKIGPAVGVSSFALKGFERDFGFRPDLRDIVGTNGGESKRAPVYWQWLGWATREQYHVLARLVSSLQRIRPELKVVVEVHGETIVAPIQGLQRYGEDVLEASRDRHLTILVSDSGAGRDRVVPRLREILGAAERIWVLRPLPWGTVVQTGQAPLPSIRERDPSLAGSGIVYAVGTPTLP